MAQDKTSYAGLLSDVYRNNKIIRYTINSFAVGTLFVILLLLIVVGVKICSDIHNDRSISFLGFALNQQKIGFTDTIYLAKHTSQEADSTSSNRAKIPLVKKEESGLLVSKPLAKANSNPPVGQTTINAKNVVNGPMNGGINGDVTIGDVPRKLGEGQKSAFVDSLDQNLFYYGLDKSIKIEVATISDKDSRKIGMELIKLLISKGYNLVTYPASFQSGSPLKGIAFDFDKQQNLFYVYVGDVQ